MAAIDGNMFLNKDIVKPTYHSKCRYDSNDKNCTEKLYTRTKDIEVFFFNFTFSLKYCTNKF
jgi:hypothetical protein